LRTRAWFRRLRLESGREFTFVKTVSFGRDVD